MKTLISQSIYGFSPFPACCLCLRNQLCALSFSFLVWYSLHSPFPVDQLLKKNQPAIQEFQEMLFQSLSREGFPGGASGKEPACKCKRCKTCGFDPWVRKIPWRRAGQPTPVFLSGEPHGQKSPVGYSPWGHKEGYDGSNLAHTLLFLEVDRMNKKRISLVLFPKSFLKTIYLFFNTFTYI